MVLPVKSVTADSELPTALKKDICLTLLVLRSTFYHGYWLMNFNLSRISKNLFVGVQGCCVL